MINKETIIDFINALVYQDYSNDFIIVNNSQAFLEITQETSLKIDKADTETILDQQNDIYKSKEDFLGKNIFNIREYCFIVDSQDYFIKDKISSEYLSNYFKFIELFELVESDKRLFPYHDTSHKKLILLSNKYGRIDLDYNYSDYKSDYFNNRISMSTIDAVIKILKDSSNYNNKDKSIYSFFKKNFEDIAKNILDNLGNNTKGSFYKVLSKLQDIVDNTNKDFDIYISSFNFSEFNSETEKELAEYQKSVRDYSADMLKSSLTYGIQLISFLLFILKFHTSSLVLYMVIITSGVLTIFSLQVAKSKLMLLEAFKRNTIKNIKIIKNKVHESCVSEEYSKEIVNLISNAKNFIKYYYCITISISNICISVLASYFLFKLF